MTKEKLKGNDWFPDEREVMTKEIEKEILKIEPTDEEVEAYTEDEWLHTIYPIKCFLAGQNSQKEKDLEMIRKLKEKSIKEKKGQTEKALSYWYETGRINVLEELQQKIKDNTTKQVVGVGDEE